MAASNALPIAAFAWLSRGGCEDFPCVRCYAGFGGIIGAGASSVFVYLSINLFLSLSNHYFVFKSRLAASTFDTHRSEDWPGATSILEGLC